MNDAAMKYDLVVGLEIHVQMNTLSKAFCAERNAFGAAPNTQVGVVSLAYPGSLPVPNQKHMEKAIRLGLALDSTIAPAVYFDRKNYFYPDLPKGYQITQDAMPICKGGFLYLANAGRKVRIHHVHMEEDAGKLIHDQDPDDTLIDLNRAGVSLLEIVTEPDLFSPEEVYEFITEIQQLVRYLDVSDGNMEEGSLRCDCNVSVKPAGSTTLGQRCEIKNVNSRRFARQAVEAEFERQIKLLGEGGVIRQQTLHFDKDRRLTIPMRSKEEAHDYRYFPDPDLPPYPVTKEAVDRIRQEMPALPWEIKETLQQEYQLSEEDASNVAGHLHDATFYLRIADALPIKHRRIWTDLFIHKIKPMDTGETFPLSENQLIGLISWIGDEKINRTVAFSTLWDAWLETPDHTLEVMAQALNIVQTDDEDFLKDLIRDAFRQFPDKAAALKNGKKNLIGLFMGEVMRTSGGKAHPQRTRQLIENLIQELE